MPASPRDDYLPTATRARLELRARLLQATRKFFDDRGYLEVETPYLSADSVVDRHLDPFVTWFASDPAQPMRGRSYYLQTSPELGMKRLLASGEFSAIYQIARVFRNGEVGPRHNPEFTLVEWYRVGDTMAEQKRLLSELAQALLGAPPAVELSYGEAFQQHLNIDPHTATVDDLAAVCQREGIAVPESLSREDRDGWLDVLLVERIEPHLGVAAPTILYDYPASQAALAVVRNGTPPVAERFELYYGGYELANGYHELLDARVLRERNRSQNALRALDRKAALPNDSRLIAAMEAGLPPCAGVALGFDRLVMIAAQAKRIDEVIALPWERA